jgi:hypothetical protein
MDLNLLTRDADNLIRKVVSRYNQLYVPAGHISQVELDLMLDDLRKLYDTFKTIGQVNLTLQQGENKPEVTVGTPMQTKSSDVTQNVSPAPKQEETPATQQEFKSEKAAEAVTETFPEPTPELKAEPEVEPESEAEPEPEIIPETEPEIIEEIRYKEEPEILADAQTYDSPVVENHVPEVEEIDETHKPVEAESPDTQYPDKQESAMLADKFNIVNKSLSETMAASSANSFVGGRMQFQPIADLATGIGLNDKFTFINELFGNNPAQYEEAITRINKAVNADEAGWILQKYHSVEWQNKAETLQRLKDFVKRRFI